jgi:hypothetical protein
VDSCQLQSTTETYHCPACGYNLRGLAVNRCPECGAYFNPHTLKATRKFRPTPVIWAALWTVVASVAAQPVSWMIQRLGWPETRGPRSREWIVHDDNVKTVPSYIPLTVWLPTALSIIAVLGIGWWLRRRLNRDGRGATAVLTSYAFLAGVLLCVAYGCMNWTALCCD